MSWVQERRPVTVDMNFNLLKCDGCGEILRGEVKVQPLGGTERQRVIALETSRDGWVFIGDNTLVEALADFCPACVITKGLKP